MKKLIIALALIAITVIAAVNLAGIFQQFSILAISNIAIQPTGWEDPSTKEWIGSFWTVLATTDINDQIATYKFDNAEAAKYGNNKIGDKTLQPTATLIIKIQPLQPYWERALDAKTWEVYPKTQTIRQNKITRQCAWGEPSVPKLDVNVKYWGVQYWTAHTPFIVTLYKNGQQIAQQTIDTYGTTQTITLRNPTDSKEWITIRDLGKIGTGYGEPQLGDILMVSSQEFIFRYTDALRTYIQYDASDHSYANYWFGGGNYYKWQDSGTGYYMVVEKAPDGSPGLFIRTIGNVLLPDNSFPGVYREDEFWDWVAKPLAAKITSDQQSDSHYSKTRLGLVNYLQNIRGCARISTTKMNVWNKGWTVTSDNKLRIYLPYGSMSSLVTIQISTELADTIVWQPPVSNVKIASLAWQAKGRIGDRELLLLTLKQESTYSDPTTATVTLTDLNNNPLNLNPPSFKVSLAKGQTTLETVDVLNTGATTETSGKIRVTVQNELGYTTDTKEIEYTLLPKGVGATTLTVYAIDKETQLSIPALSVGINYGTTSLLRITGDDGAFTIDLEGYQGAVTVSSAETDYYKSTSTTTEVSLGPNSCYHYVEPKGYIPPPIEADWWLILIIAVAAIVVIIILYAVWKHRQTA